MATDDMLRDLLAEVKELRAELAQLRAVPAPAPDQGGPNSYWYYRAKFDSANESGRIQAADHRRKRDQEEKDKKIRQSFSR